MTTQPTAPTVYLVDNDEALLETLSLSLKAAGLQVQSYPSAQAFLAAYQPCHPSCLVLDVQMPEMDGLELQDVLNTQQVQIPIIFITGHAEIPLSVKAVKAGAIDFLEKPFRRQVLLDRIEEALAQDQRLQQEHADKENTLMRFHRLTPREQEVMALVAEGKSNKEIAKVLNVSHRTVETHRARVIEKMEAQSLSDLIAMAVICGVHDLHY